MSCLTFIPYTVPPPKLSRSKNVSSNARFTRIDQFPDKLLTEPSTELDARLHDEPEMTVAAPHGCNRKREAATTGSRGAGVAGSPDLQTVIEDDDDDDGHLSKKQKRYRPTCTNQAPDQLIDRPHDQSCQGEDDTVCIDRPSEVGSQDNPIEINNDSETEVDDLWTESDDTDPETDSPDKARILADEPDSDEEFPPVEELFNTSAMHYRRNERSSKLEDDATSDGSGTSGKENTIETADENHTKAGDIVSEPSCSGLEDRDCLVARLAVNGNGYDERISIDVATASPSKVTPTPQEQFQSRDEMAQPDGEEWEVEEIIDVRETESGREYRVVWGNSWVPKGALGNAQEALHKFELNRTQRKRRGRPPGRKNCRQM